MTEPLTPAGSNLQDFPHTPVYRARLFGSSFHARATDAEWRAGVTLWLKSWDQVPAGSLPDDDIELCRLAELARDLKLWAKVKEGALRGWVQCDDGRLYHPVVAEGINNAIEAKAKQRQKTLKARIAALEKHLKDAKTQDEKVRLTEDIRKLKQGLSQTLSQDQSQTVSLEPREGEEREKEKGTSLVPDGTGADAPLLDQPEVLPSVSRSGGPIELDDDPPAGAASSPPRHRAIACPDGIDPQIWADFMQVRKAKRAPLTATGLTGLIREAAKAGLTLEAALQMCCQRGWQGFEARWIDALPRNAGPFTTNKAEALEAGNLAAARRFAQQGEPDEAP